MSDIGNPPDGWDLNGLGEAFVRRQPDGWYVIAPVPDGTWRLTHEGDHDLGTFYKLSDAVDAVRHATRINLERWRNEGPANSTPAPRVGHASDLLLKHETPDVE